MKKINFKKILSFFSIAILISIKIFGYIDNTSDMFSLDIYSTIKILVNILICLATLYIIYGILDLFKNSIVVSLVDILTGALFGLSYFFINNNSIISYIIVVCNIILVFINLIISIAIKNKNSEVKIKDNIVSTLIEIVIALVLFFIVVCVASKPIFDGTAGVKTNADKLSKNISQFSLNEDIYIVMEENSESGDLYYNILNENYESVGEYSEESNDLVFAKLYKDDNYSLIGILKDESLNKYYLVNSKIDKVCELENVGNPNYLDEYLLDILNYAIDNKLINYDSADFQLDLDEKFKTNLYIETDFDGKEYEEENFEYKYFENENNSNYVIQIAYNPDIVNHSDNIMDQLFYDSNTNIDDLNSLYDMDRHYSLINISKDEIYELDCENLLFNEGIYAFADGSIPFYDNEEKGFFDLNGKKHIDGENELTINSYNNFRIVYNSENEKYFIIDNINNESIKEYDNIYTFEKYIICLNKEKYEMLNPLDLSIIDEYIIGDFEYLEENLIEENEEDIDESVAEEETDNEEDDENDSENISEDLEEIEVISSYRNDVIVYNNEELILLENSLKGNYILLHYDSSNNTVKVLSEDIQYFDAVNKSGEKSNSFYVNSNLF